MTASGKCRVCGELATRFHYTRQRKDEFDSHEGFWHCEEHGPVPIITSNSSNIIDEPKMNRAQRRAMLKRMRK